jgi:hypothetical protein
MRSSPTFTPVIQPDDAYDLSLDPGFQKTVSVRYLLMRQCEVSSRVLCPSPAKNTHVSNLTPVSV